MLLISSSGPLLADDQDKPAAEVNESTPEAEKPKEEAKPDAEKPKGSVSERLLNTVLGDEEGQATVNPLDPIVEKMRAAQQRLQKSETDQETRTLQAQVVKSLDELIDKLKNQKPPPKSNQNNQSPPPPPMDSSSQTPPRGSGQQPKPQNSQQQKGGAEQKSKSQPQQGKSGGTQAQQAKDSSTNLSQPRTPEEEAARQRLAKDVWGHLPPALRQQLLNVYSEKFLPKYDDLVRKYYEALAEQNRKNP